MRIIVTGANGYIGRRLVCALEADGHKVASIDIGDSLKSLEGRWDVMFNLAWTGKGGALRADYTVQMSNVKTALDNYRVAVCLGCGRYVCPGTIGENMVNIKECTGIKSENFIYAISKNYLHQLLDAVAVEKCRVVWATLGNLYGGDSGGNIINWALENVLSGSVAEFGPAEQPYDFIHVDDAVRALVLLGTSDGVRSESFYVGNGKPKPLKEYLIEIGRLAGKMELIGIGRRPDDGTRYREEWFDVEKLCLETGFSAVKDFSDGVMEMITEFERVKYGR